MSTKQVLIDAKAQLRDRGWTKGELVDKTSGRCCLLGAIGLATDEEEFLSTSGAVQYFQWFWNAGLAGDAVQAVAKAISPTEDLDPDTNHHTVYGFNDHSERTESEVFELLDRAIAAADD